MTRRATLALPLAAAAADSKTSLCFSSAVDLAQRLRKKDISAREVLDAHLRQIERVNPKVNAIVTLVADQAMAAAKRADEAAARGQWLGPLHGLPVAHKDLQETKGIRTTYGSPLFKDNVPAYSTLLVERIQQAGAITIGKTNTPEFGAGSQTFNPVFGATKNPWDLTKTCGGSSGGAATALAARLIPLADGSDTGGSLRNPAAFCGVVGLRTSPGRVPRVPTGSAMNILSVVGPMGRTPADTALLLSAIAGPDPRAPLSIHEPGSLFARPLARSFKGVRVAWFKDLGGLPFDRRVRDAVHARRKTLEDLGCVVEEAEPDFADAEEIFKVLRALGFFQQHAAKVERYRAQIKDTVLEEVDRGAKLTAAQIMQAETKRSKLFERMGQFFSKYEFFALPTAQVPAFDVSTPYITEIEGVKMGNYIDWMRSCWYITLTGQPAISVNAGFTPESLPIGLQLVGRLQDDWGVLQLAHAVETAAPSTRVPAVATA